MADGTNFFHHLFHHSAAGESFQHPLSPLDHPEPHNPLQETQISAPNFFESLFFDIFERDHHHCSTMSDDSSETLHHFESEFEPSGSNLECDSDSNSDLDHLDCECGDDGEDQVRFITNLFERCADCENEESESDRELDLVAGVGQTSDDMDVYEVSDSKILSQNTQPEGKEGETIVRSSEVNLELGLGISCRESSAAVSQSTEVNLELGLGISCRGSSAAVSQSSEIKDATSSAAATVNSQGLRVVGMDSDSDSEEIESFSVEYTSHHDEYHGTRSLVGVTNSDEPLFCWDYLGFNNEGNGTDHIAGVQEREDNNGEGIYLEYSDTRSDHDEGIDQVDTLSNQHQEGEMIDSSSILSDHDAVDEVNFFDQYPGMGLEVSIPSDDNEDRFFGDGPEESMDMDDLEWEILLAANSFSRDVHDAIFGDIYIVEESLNNDSIRGSPPAAKSIVENLPVIDITSSKEEFTDGTVCAVCKDEFLTEEEPPRQLPCHHYYHSGCIIPWLNMRNTCPVCRFELPTDDSEYEGRKRWRSEAIE